MSARTCLLCGKPLSRIWVGAGDDFCSREHGNQYRLKRGMDRLTETNKISSLMRRRESPRLITTASLPLDSASARRDFPEMSLPPAGGTRFPSLRPLSVPSTPRLSLASDRYVEPHLPSRAGSFAPRQPDSSHLRFSARKTAPVAHLRRAALPMRIPRAQARQLDDRILGTRGEHRDFGALRHAGIRAHVGLDGMAPSRIELPGAACFLDAWRPRRIEAPLRTSRAPRLPRSFGSRRLAPRTAVCVRPLKTRAAAAALASPARPIPSVRKALNRPAARRAMSRRISTRELVCPSFRARVNATGLKWPAAARIGRRRPFNGHALALREWGPLWNVSGLPGLFSPRRSLGALLVERGTPTPRVVALPLAPVRFNGAHHVAVAPFNPQNSPFGYKEYQEK